MAKGMAKEEKAKEGKEACMRLTYGVDPTAAAIGAITIGVIGQASDRWGYSQRRCPRPWSDRAEGG